MQFEYLYQELACGADIIRTLVMGISRDEARVKPDPESWSVLEVMCHLYDIEREDFRPRLDAMLLRPGEQWNQIDPQSWVTRQSYNQRNLAETLAGFLAEREKSLFDTNPPIGCSFLSEGIEKFENKIAYRFYAILTRFLAAAPTLTHLGGGGVTCRAKTPRRL